MNSLASDLRNTWALLNAIFSVGICIGLVIIPLAVLLREVCGAKAAEIRRTR